MSLGGSIDLPTIKQRFVVDDSALGGMAGRFGAMGKALGTAVVAGVAVAGAAVAGFVVAGVKGAMEVERGLREVNSLFGLTGAAADESFAQLQEGVAGLSDEVGIAQSVLVDGLYQAISAGVPRDNVFDFMQVAAQASVAGVTDVETAVNGISSTLNAFGLDASDAQAVADSMFATVAGGKTTFAELSDSLFNVAPAAAAAGVGFQEVNAAIATLTSAGTPTSVATTQIRAAIVGLQRPSEEMTAIFQAAGYESAQMALESEGLGAALDVVSKAADGDNGKLQTLLGSVEAVGATQILAGTGAAKFAEELARQEGSAGAATTAFEEMEKSTSRQMAKLGNTFKNIGIQVGNVLLPILNKVVDWASRSIGPAFETVKRVFGGVWAAIKPVIDLVRNLIGTFSRAGDATSGSMGRAQQVVMAFQVAARRAFGSVKEVIDKVAATFRTIAGVITKWTTENRDKIETFTRKIGDVFEQVAALLADVWALIATIIGGAIDGIMFVWDRWGEQIMNVVSVVWTTIATVIEAVIKVIRGVINTVTALIKGDWEGVWNGIKQIFGGVWDAIRGVVEGVFGWVENFMATVNGNIQRAWENVWNGIKDFFGGIWDAIVDVVRGQLNWIIGAINKFIRFWNGLEFTVPKIELPGGLGTIGGFTVGLPNLSEIPLLARGGDVVRSGLAIAGERGPELLDLRAGARVTPLENVGGTQLGPFYVEAFDVRAAARELSREMAYASALASVPGGN